MHPEGADRCGSVPSAAAWLSGPVLASHSRRHPPGNDSAPTSELACLKRFLVFGALGVLDEESELARCPDWYALFIAADRCHCTPWELLKQPSWWKFTALKAVQAENGARKMLEQHGM